MSEPAVAHKRTANVIDTEATRRFLFGGRLWIIVLFGLLTFVVLFWLPFGFKTTGLMEEWMIIHDWEVGGHSEQGQDVGLFVTTGTLVMRPMDTTWFILAHEVTPDSFLSFNLYTILTFFLKGLLLYAILRKLLPDNPLFASSTALLFVIFPADDGLFTFRGMNIHTAVCLYLLGVYLLLSYYEKPHVLKLIGMWGTLIVSLFTYELAHPLIAFTPFLLLWKERRLTTRMVRLALLWWFAPLTAFLYEALAFTRGETYQSWVLARSGLNATGVVREIAESMWMAYRRHFVDGWISALQEMSLTSRLFPIALAVWGTAAATIGAHLPLARHSMPVGNRRYVELFLMGIIVIFLSYVVYMITPYRQLTWRVYYFSAIGGTISIASLVYFLSRWFRLWEIVFGIGMCALIGLAGVRALNQHQYYVGLSLQQQQLLRGIARAVPQFRVPATLIVVDETGRYQSNWSLGTSYLIEDALRYLYNDYSLDAVLCYFKLQQGAFGTLPELHEQCEFGADEVRLYEDGKLVEVQNYNHVVVVRVTEGGVSMLGSIPPQYMDGIGGEAYDPTSLVDVSAVPPYRYHTLFSLSE